MTPVTVAVGIAAVVLLTELLLVWRIRAYLRRRDRRLSEQRVPPGVVAPGRRRR